MFGSGHLTLRISYFVKTVLFGLFVFLKRIFVGKAVSFVVSALVIGICAVTNVGAFSVFHSHTLTRG